MDTSTDQTGGVGLEPAVEGTPDEKTSLESSLCMEDPAVTAKVEDFVDQIEAGASYFDDYDYYPLPPDDCCYTDEKPFDVSVESEEKIMADVPDQQEQSVSGANRKPLLQDSPLNNELQEADCGDREKEIQEEHREAESVPLPPDDDYKFSLDETPSDLLDVLPKKPATEAPDQRELRLEGEYVSGSRQEAIQERVGSPRQEALPEGGTQREEIEESVGQSEKTTPKEISTANVFDKTKVEVEIVSEIVTPTEPNVDTQTRLEANGTKTKFSDEELRKICELAKKLCKTRSVYNQNVCRPFVKRILPLKKKKINLSETRGLSRTRTNRGVCTVGKGEKELYDDPPEWDWGQPLPKEISEVIPSKPPPETPTISHLDDDECSNSFPPYFEKAGSSLPSRQKNLSPKSKKKNLKISISVTRFKNSPDTTIVLSDSDEELPDFSMKLGIPPRKTDLCSRESFEVTSTGSSCTVIHSSTPQSLAPASRLNVRKRRHGTRNRASSAPNHPNVNPHEIVVLGSSDESDVDLEVVQVTKKPAPSEAPKKSNPVLKTEEKQSTNEWTCPICLEPKDKVEKIMSTYCGHIFCGPCLQSTIRINKQCPNCRKKLTLRQIHNVYL